MPTSPTLGIVAGGGTLPARLAAACLERGRACLILGLEGHADPALLPPGAPVAWIRLGAATQGFAILRERGVGELVLAGAVRRPSLRELAPDARTAAFFARLGFRALGDDGLLKAVIAEIEREGFTVVAADSILAGVVAPVGSWGVRRPDARDEADIARGLEVARALGRVDVGQAVVVQQGQVLGVEAAEGTDALIARAGALRRDGGGGVLVKIAKPGQDRRVDLPTVGPATIAALSAAGLAGLAVEAGGAMLLDREAMVAAADAAGLFLVGVEG